MAWTPPYTFTAGATLTAAQMNAMTANDAALYQSQVRLDLETRTTDYTVSSGTIAGAANVFTTSATFTADGVSAYIVEFYCSRVEAPAQATAYTSVNLVDSAGTGLTLLGLVQSAANIVTSAPVFARYRYTPSAGSITLNVRGTCSASPGYIHGGSGGTAVLSYPPTYLAVYGPDLT